MPRSPLPAPAATLAVLAVLALSGCVVLNTHRVPGGPAGCQAVCAKWGMELSGMVQVGQDSDACVCAVKKEAAPAAGPTSGSRGVLPSGATVAALSAVERMRSEEGPDDLQAGAGMPAGTGLLPSIEIPLPTSAGPGQPPLVP